MKISPKLLRSGLTGVFMTLAAGVGYFLRALQGDSGSVMPIKDMPALEFYRSAASFSEIENEKANLEALAAQYLIELRVRHEANASDQVNGRRPANPIYAVDPGQAIQEIEKGVEEFKGTEQELLFVQELLWLLKKERLHDRWLDVYLNVLYERPTCAVVNQFAAEALRVSKAARREHDLVAGFEHLSSIPIDFPAKNQAEDRFKAAALATRRTQTAQPVL